jgi:hypothetical protein
MHARERFRRPQSPRVAGGQDDDAQLRQPGGIHCYHGDMNDELKKSYGSLKRRPFLTPLWLAAFAAAIVASLAAWLWSTAGATTVVVVRHAEKQLDGSADPPLAAVGEARAASLARMFGEAKSPGHIDAIYVSPALRDRLTAAPLAARLGLTPLVVAQDDPRALVGRVLHEHSGERGLIVGPFLRWWPR